MVQKNNPWLPTAVTDHFHTLRANQRHNNMIGKAMITLAAYAIRHPQNNIHQGRGNGFGSAPMSEMA
jgi:hypothetical protein